MVHFVIYFYLNVFYYYLFLHRMGKGYVYIYDGGWNKSEGDS